MTPSYTCSPIHAKPLRPRPRANRHSPPDRSKCGSSLHTAEPLLTGEGYAGRELHRAARIAAAGHGGQMLLSASTRTAVDGEVTDLGEHAWSR